jgi:hypothetical protein
LFDARTVSKSTFIIFFSTFFYFKLKYIHDIQPFLKYWCCAILTFNWLFIWRNIYYYNRTPLRYSYLSFFLNIQRIVGIYYTNPLSIRPQRLDVFLLHRARWSNSNVRLPSVLNSSWLITLSF